MTFQQPTDQFADEQSEAGSAITQFAEDVAGSLMTPSQTLREVGERGAIVPAVLLVMLIVLVTMAGQMVVTLLELFQVPGFRSPVSPMIAGPTAAVQVTSMLWNLIWVPVFWTIIAGILYLIARALGGNGQFGSLWAATGFALTPQLLIAPFTSVSELMGVVGGAAQFFGWLVVFPLTVAGFIWTLVLYAIAIRETMALSTGQAIGTLAILLGVLLGFGILLICVFVVFIVGIIGAIAAA